MTTSRHHKHAKTTTYPVDNFTYEDKFVYPMEYGRSIHSEDCRDALVWSGDLSCISEGDGSLSGRGLA